MLMNKKLNTRLKQSLKIFPAVLAAGLTVAGCEGTSTETTSGLRADPANPERSPALCAAVRGNGQLIWAHFGALARILESEGRLIDGIAGGSSASMTAFLYESIVNNPAVRRADLSPAAQADRAALLMKSIYHWIAVFGDTPEGRALSHIAEVQAKLAGFDRGRLDDEDLAEVRQALEDLALLLQSKEIIGLIDKEMIDFLLDTSLLQTESGEGQRIFHFRVNEIKKGLEGFGSFSASDPAILYRPGFIDFRQVARYLGAIGDFYADSHGLNAGRLDGWFDQCPVQDNFSP